MTEATPEDWHGTISGYYGRKCRCADCREAIRVYYHEVVKAEPRKPCQVEGCAKLASPRRKYCSVHCKRLSKTGEVGAPETGTKGGDDVGYQAAHKRVVAARGKAKTYPCCECGGPAHDWAYIHGSPGERPGGTAPNGQPHGPYSLTPDEYQPMCKACHKDYDLAQTGKAAIRCHSCGQRVRAA